MIFKVPNNPNHSVDSSITGIMKKSSEIAIKGYSALKLMETRQRKLVKKEYQDREINSMNFPRLNFSS